MGWMVVAAVVIIVAVAYLLYMMAAFADGITKAMMI